MGATAAGTVTVALGCVEQFRFRMNALRRGAPVATEITSLEVEDQPGSRSVEVFAPPLMKNQHGRLSSPLSRYSRACHFRPALRWELSAAKQVSAILRIGWG